MKLTAYLLLTIACIFSCHGPNYDHYKNLIIGDWLFVKVERSESVQTDSLDVYTPTKMLHGYTFKEGGVCQSLPGYFKMSESTDIEFSGKNTKYVLYKDSLRIFNLARNGWDKRRIVSLTDKNLVLQIDDTTNLIYKKEIHPIARKLSFDKIIVSLSSSSGYSARDIVLSKNGDIVFYNEPWRKKNGMFTSKISLQDFQNIEDDFSKAHIDGLKNIYECTCSEFEQVTVTFIKDGKIYKTVRDEGAEAPKEFYWAYNSTTYLYQLLKLQPESIDQRFPNEMYAFKKGNKIISLERSEGFYLSYLLKSAKVVKEKFKADFLLYSLSQNEFDDIRTDGRFYKIKLKDGTSETLDLGYNFLVKNELMKKAVIN